MGNFFEHVFARCLKRIRSTRKNVLRSADPRHLHALRGAILRLDFALRLYRRELQDREVDMIAEYIGRARKLLGRARNFDVLAERVADDSRQIHLSGRKERRVAGYVEHERGRYRRKVITMIHSSWYMVFEADLRALIGQARACAARQRGFARRLLQDTLGQVERYKTKNIIHDLHNLRKDFKDLRYTLEFLSSYYRVKTIKIQKPVIVFQDVLGARQDAITASEILSRSKVKCPQGLIKREEEQIGRAEKKFKSRWKKCMPGLRRRLLRQF